MMALKLSCLPLMAFSENEFLLAASFQLVAQPGKLPRLLEKFGPVDLQFLAVFLCSSFSSSFHVYFKMRSICNIQ